MEKISIVIPTFNQSGYIKEAIDSIINQTETDWKLYIVNDGSTDNTKDIVQSYLSDKIVYFEKENGGAGSALNYGFRKATGLYHAYISSDNTYLPNYLSSLCGVLDTMSNVGFVYSDFQFMNEAGELGQKIIRPTWVQNQLLSGCVIGLCFMWRKELFEKIGGFEEHCTEEDYGFAIKCEELCDLYHVPEILGYYRDHSQTVTRLKKTDKSNDLVMEARKRRGLIQ